MKRDYYYELTEKGLLTIDGFIQDDPWFLDFFFRRLAPTADEHYKEYPFVCRCGDEMNYLKPHDTAIVYHGIEGGKLLFGNSLTVFFNPSRLAVSDAGVLYHWAPVGEWGRVAANVALEIGENVVHWGPFLAFKDPITNVCSPILPLWLQDQYTFIRPKRDNHCVGCGEANPYSLKLSFVLDKSNDEVATYVQPSVQMMGALGIVHGGFISLLLDETMGKSLSVRGIKAPTASLDVRFKAPMIVDEHYCVKSSIVNVDGRKYTLKAQIFKWNDPGKIVASARALFITPKSS